MDDLFMDEEEFNNRRKGKYLFFIIIIMIITVLVVAYQLHDMFKPLPNTDKCKNLGYEAGEVKGISNVCYDDCENNKLSSCNNIRIIR